MTLTIDVVQPGDLDGLVAFARKHEQALLTRYSSIPAPVPDALSTSLQYRLEHGTGVIARLNGDIVGCLTVVGPIEHFRPHAKGVYAPLLSCLAEGSDIDRTFTSMLTELGGCSSLTGVDIAAFTCPVTDPAFNHTLSQNGFGVRCADAVVSLDDLPTLAPEIGLVIEEVPWQRATELIEPKRSLGKHLASSPMFMEHFDFSPEFIASKSEERQSVHVAARDGDRYIAYIEATFDGENYLTRSPQMRNICGAGVLPEYRNCGIMQALLVLLADKYRAEGVQALGVDYETFNPNARGFWERFFQPYTWSWERRFDLPWSAE